MSALIVSDWPRNAAKLGSTPVVSGIRNGTSSCESCGEVRTIEPDAGIGSAGSEYGGLPLIWLFARLAVFVIPTVSNRFAASAEVAQAPRTPSNARPAPTPRYTRLLRFSTALSPSSSLPARSATSRR